MAENAAKQGKLDSFAAIFLFIFLPCMWGLGLQNDSPISHVAGGRNQSRKCATNYLRIENSGGVRVQGGHTKLFKFTIFP